jgi:hypothetical protein
MNICLHIVNQMPFFVVFITLSITSKKQTINCTIQNQKRKRMCRNDGEKTRHRALCKGKDLYLAILISLRIYGSSASLEGEGEAAGVLSQLFPLTYRSCSDTCRSIRSCL